VADEIHPGEPTRRSAAGPSTSAAIRKCLSGSCRFWWTSTRRRRDEPADADHPLFPHRSSATMKSGKVDCGGVFGEFGTGGGCPRMALSQVNSPSRLKLLNGRSR
jgi:hypothetical protein